MNLKQKKMLHERRQKQRSTYYIIELISNFRTCKTNLLWYKVNQGLTRVFKVGNGLLRETKKLWGCYE